MQIEKEYQQESQKNIKSSKSIENYGLGDLNLQKVLICQKIKNQKNYEIQSRKFFKNQKKFLSRNDYLKNELFNLVQERKDREYFDNIFRQNLCFDAKQEHHNSKIRKIRNNVFQRVNCQLITHKILKLEFKNTQNFSPKLQNYLNTNKIQFEQNYEKKEYVTQVNKLHKIVRKFIRDKLENFYQIKYFQNIIKKKQDFKQNSSKMIKKKQSENFIRKGNRVNLISLDKNSREFYKLFYEVNHDADYFSNFYQNTLTNNYNNSINYLEEIPFYLTYKEIHEQKHKKFNSEKKEEIDEENKMEIEDDENNVEFIEYFNNDIHDPIIFDNDKYTREDQYNLTNQFFLDDLRNQDTDHCIIQKASSRINIFKIFNAMCQNNFVAYFENENKFKVISDDENLLKFKKEIPEVFKYSLKILYLIYNAIQNFRNYREIENNLLHNIFIINTGIDQDMLKNLIIYVQYLTGEHFGEIQNQGFYIENLIHQKNLFLNKKQDEEFKENFKIFKKKIQKSKPEDYKAILNNQQKFLIKQRIQKLEIKQPQEKKQEKNKKINFENQIEQINKIYTPFYDDKIKVSDFYKSNKIFKQQCEKYEEELNKKYNQI